MVAIKSISRILAVLLIALVFVDFALAASVSVDSFNPGADSWVSALAVQPDGKILVGGYFSQLGGAARSYIGQLNADGSLDTSFTPSANDIVISLAIQPDGKVLVGGAFTALNGITRNKIGRLNADGTLDTSFNPGANGSIHTFTLQPDGKILVGGEFTTLGGSARSKLGRLNADGSLDTSFNPGASMTNINQAVVYALAVQSDGKILVGGEFTVLGGGARYRIGRLNANGSLDTSFNTTAYFSTVTGLIVQPDGKILVGGGAINRLNADGSADSSFSAGTNNVNSASMGLQLDGKIILGGFSGATHYVKWLNSNGSLDTNFDPGNASYINSLAIQPDGKLIVGGNFAALNGISRNNIGRLSNGSSASVQNITSDSDGTTLAWQRSGAGPEVSYGTFELSTDGVSYTLLGIGARINGGWQLTGLTLPKEQSLFIRARGYYGSGASSGSVVEYVGNIYISHIPLTLTVTKIADTNDGVCDNDCSLREAIAASATGDTINFDSLLSGQSITLSSTLNINNNLTIDGSALALKITISGNNSVPVFEVSSSITTTLTSLIISKGKSGDYGGGIRNLGTLYLLNSIVSDNSAIESGGGIHNLGRLNIANSTISNNSSYFGGGVLNLGESLQIANTTIVGNSATEGGGIHNASALSLSNSTVSNNSARGGGIISIGTMNIANSTFSGNSSSEEGGGILNYGPLTITNSTFSGNSAVTWGGGIYNGNGPLNLTNTIISNSTAGGDCYNDNTISATMGVNINNLVEANAASPNNCGTPAFISDPKLGVLSNNGDLTQTMPLGAGSPAIDAGNDANCPATDQRGMTRPQGSHCDIGAYEYILPSLDWNTFLGGSFGYDVGVDIFVDGLGNIYVVGTSYGYFIDSIQTNPTWGNPNRPFGGGDSDAFIAKLDPSGALIWNTFLGGIGSDDMGGVAVDGSGNIYVAGNSSSSWGNPIQTHRNSSTDGFIAKLDSSGVLTWNTFLGSGGVDGIDLDVNGNIYLMGSSANDWSISNIPLNPHGGNVDAFVTKMTPSGSLIWHTFLGGSAEDFASEIVVGGDGNIYLMGTSYSSWGNPILPYNPSQFRKAFVAKLDSSGALAWNTFLGSGRDWGWDIAIDGNENVYVVGVSSGTWGTPVRPFDDSLPFSSNAFAAKLNSTGNLIWNTFLGNDGDDGSGIDVDDMGHVYVVGVGCHSWGNPFRAVSVCADAFIAKLDGFGNLLDNGFLGGTSSDGGGSVYVNGEGNVYMIGGSEDGWETPVRSFSGKNYYGQTDTFVAKLNFTIPPHKVISIVRANPNPTAAASVNFTVNFSESVTGVDASDFTLTTTGGVSGAAVSGVSGLGSVYTVTVNTGSGRGTIRLNIVDDNSILNAASNPLGGAAVGDGNFGGGEFYTINRPIQDVITDTWAVKVSPSANVNQLALQLDAQNLGQIGTLPGYYLFRISGSNTQPKTVTDLLAANPLVLWFEQQTAHQQSARGNSNQNGNPAEVITATSTIEDVQSQDNTGDVSAINTLQAILSPVPTQVTINDFQPSPEPLQLLVTEAAPAQVVIIQPVSTTTQLFIAVPVSTQTTITQIPPSSIPTKPIQGTKMAVLPNEPSVISTTMIRSAAPTTDSENRSSKHSTEAAVLSIAVGSILFSMRRKMDTVGKSSKSK